MMLFLMVGVGLGSVPAHGQSDTPPAEIADQAESTGTAAADQEGQQSDPATGAPEKKTKTWAEMVENWMTPRPIAKSIIVRIDEQYCYPHRAVSFKMEIVREDDHDVRSRRCVGRDRRCSREKSERREEPLAHRGVLPTMRPSASARASPGCSGREVDRQATC